LNSIGKVKLFFLFLTIFLFTNSTAFASEPSSWTEVFYETYGSAGVDEAVLFGLSEAKSPNEIIATALVIENLEEPRLIQALFCALVLPGDIYAAAEANNISEETVSKGYELSLAVCAKEMEEILAVVMNPTAQFSDPTPANSSVFASPTTFQ